MEELDNLRLEHLKFRNKEGPEIGDIETLIFDF